MTRRQTQLRETQETVEQSVKPTLIQLLRYRVPYGQLNGCSSQSALSRLGSHETAPEHTRQCASRHSRVSALWHVHVCACARCTAAEPPRRTIQLFAQGGVDAMRQIILVCGVTNERTITTVANNNIFQWVYICCVASGQCDCVWRCYAEYNMQHSSTNILHSSSLLCEQRTKL